MLKRGVKKKFFIGTLGIVFVFGLATLLLVRIILYDALYANLEKRGAFIVSRVAKDSISSVLTENQFELQLMINDLRPVRTTLRISSFSAMTARCWRIPS